MNMTRHRQELGTFEDFVHGHRELATTVPVTSHRRLRSAWRSTGWTGWALAATWVAAITIIILTEPAPANPSAPEPAWGLALASIVLLTLPLALGGLMLGRTWGFGASLVTAVSSFGLAVGCFASQHHAGLYPYGEALVFGAIGLASWRALRTRRAGG